jgi:hypothetical protein
MKRLFTLSLALSIAALIASASVPAAAKGVTRCVGGPKCFATIQAAVDAATNGDTIAIGRGTFTGGVTVTKSVALRGAGASSTTIRGGGPVLTIGTFGAATEPTVAISGLTITGGVTTSSPESVPFVGQENVFAAGGGIEIPPAGGSNPGATVTISNSVIAGNRVTPTATLPLGPPCPAGPCPFAGAFGGGIDTWGSLTLTDSVVSSNVAAGLASDADGGAIASHFGDLVLTNVRVTGNQATAVIPNGRFAEGGGLFIAGGSLTVRNSVFDRNVASLTSNLPSFAGGNLIDMNANSGGIHVGDGIPVSVENTAITNNAVTAVDPFGEPCAIDSAMLVGASPLTMRATLISGNSVSGTVATSADVGPCGSALELDGGGMISNSQIIGNPSSEVSSTGDAAVNGALAVLTFNNDPKLVTVDHSIISGNSASATSASGSASAQGGGVFTNSLLTLDHVLVSGNAAKAQAPAGEAQGGGIWNGIELSGPPVELTLDHSSVIHNQSVGSSAINLQGGGLYTNQPVTVDHSLIALNAPDQCFGC